jgi:acetyltransferase
VGEAPHPARWNGCFCAAGAAQRRAALSDVFRPRDYGGSAAAVLRAGQEFSHTFIARFTQLDYARAMALIVLESASGDMLGVVRLHANANYHSGEYAILVRSDLKGRGLGWLLIQMIIEYARAEGLRRIEGQVLAENTTMLAMCRELGFTVTADAQDPDTCFVTLAL